VLNLRKDVEHFESGFHPVLGFINGGAGRGLETDHELAAVKGGHELCLKELNA
jgi:hypothetical protein